AALDGARAPVVALAVAEALDAGILRHIAARSTSRAVLIVDALGEFAGELGELCQLGSRRLCTVEAQLRRPHDNLSAAKGTRGTSGNRRGGDGQPRSRGRPAGPSLPWSGGHHGRRAAWRTSAAMSRRSR